jgi:hypothetical protein
VEITATLEGDGMAARAEVSDRPRGELSVVEVDAAAFERLPQ